MKFKLDMDWFGPTAPDEVVLRTNDRRTLSGKRYRKHDIHELPEWLRDYLPSGTVILDDDGTPVEKVIRRHRDVRPKPAQAIERLIVPFGDAPPKPEPEPERPVSVDEANAQSVTQAVAEAQDRVDEAEAKRREAAREKMFGGEAEEEKPKRKRRTKAEIEADKARKA